MTWDLPFFAFSRILCSLHGHMERKVWLRYFFQVFLSDFCWIPWRKVSIEKLISPRYLRGRILVPGEEIFLHMLDLIIEKLKIAQFLMKKVPQREE